MMFTQDSTRISIILEGIKFILTNNTIKFNREYYKQIKGTAMGRAVGEQIAKESPEKECQSFLKE